MSPLPPSATQAHPVDMEPIIKFRRTPSLALMYLPAVIDFVGVFILSPVMPFLVGQYGADKDLGSGKSMSFVMTAYSAGQFIGAPALGWLSDKTGNRKACLVGAVMLSCVTYFGAAICPNYWLFVVLRFGNGLACGTRPVIFAFMSDIVPYKQMAKFSILVGTIAAVVSAITPLIGGYMTSLFSATTPLWFNSGLALLIAISMALGLKDPKYYVEKTIAIQTAELEAELARNGDVETGNTLRKTESTISEEKKPSAPPATATFKDEAAEKLSKLTIMILAACCLAASSNSYNNQAWNTLFGLVLKQNHGMKPKDCGALMAIQGVAQFFVCVFVFVRLTKMLPIPLVVSIGCAMYTIPILLAAAPDALWFLIVLGCVIRIAGTFIGGASPIIVKLVTPVSHRGKINGMYTSIGKGIALLAPLTAGPLYDIGLALPFIAMGGVGCLGLLASIFAWKGVNTFQADLAAKKAAQTA